MSVSIAVGTERISVIPVFTEDCNLNQTSHIPPFGGGALESCS